MSLETLTESVRAKVPQMHDLTRSWVEINSYSRNVAGVNACGAALARAFEMRGLSLRIEAGATGYGDHLFWATPAAAARPPILLIGHHDTVFPPGHFEGYTTEGGRGHGPGCLDMKGGIAVLWGALRSLSEAELLGELPLVVVSVADEEIGSLDSKPHLEALARRSECALVFESGRAEDKIVTQRRGGSTLQVAVVGRAAHAGNAHADGANAIWSLSRFVDAAQQLTDYSRGITVNVGTVTGGTATNTVPEAAAASVDVRFESVADAHALLAALHERALRCALPGTRIEVAGGVKRLPMEKTAASHALYREYAECQRAAGLGDGENPLVGGGSDANTVSGVGLAAIDGLGPRGGGFHTRTEFVELNSFGPKAEALVRFLHGRLLASRAV